MRNYRFLGLFTILYITFQLVSDVAAGKIISFCGHPVSVTVLFFPITYLFSDILTEVYGYAQARKVVWQVLIASVLAGLLYQLVVIIPPTATFDADDAYARVLGSVPRILVGGWLAVWTGGILNDYVMAKMKLWTNGKHLWSRTITSTIVGELANTMIFYFIALAGVLPQGVLIQAILTGWIIKSGVEIILTPWTYWVIAKLKRLEGEDFYDRDTNFNPFIYSPDIIKKR